MGVPDEILVHMSRGQIIEHCGLTAEDVASRFRVDKDAAVPSELQVHLTCARCAGEGDGGPRSDGCCW